MILTRPCSLLTGTPYVAEALLFPQVFLEKYGYLHHDKHVHDAEEMLSAIR